ncbi:hypothetical protein BH10PLA2_BH10PLA2_12320 [soil metagenome]
MEKSRADFTHTFRDLSIERPPPGDRYLEPDFQAWHARWQLRHSRDGKPSRSAYTLMQAVNPVVIARNHRVEEALAAAEEQDDLAPLQRLLAILVRPFELGPDTAHFQEAPADDSEYRTFCGT